MIDAFKCPACGADWDAGPIPLEARHQYNGKTRFSRIIQVAHCNNEGFVTSSYWTCPDCQATWARRPREVTWREEREIERLMREIR